MSKIFQEQLVLQSAPATTDISSSTNRFNPLLDENEQYDFRATSSLPPNEASALFQRPLLPVYQQPPRASQLPVYQQPLRASQLPVHKQPLRASQLPVYQSPKEIVPTPTPTSSHIPGFQLPLNANLDKNYSDFWASTSLPTNPVLAPPRPLRACQLTVYKSPEESLSANPHPQVPPPLNSGDLKEKKSSWSSELFSGSPKFLNSRDSINNPEDQEHSLSLNSLDPNQSPSTPPISSNNSENQADPSSLHSVDESQQIRFTVAIGISASPHGVFESELTHPGEVNSSPLSTPLTGYSGIRGQLHLPPIPFISRARLKPHARTQSLRSPTMASNTHPRDIIGRDSTATTGTNPHLPSKGLPAEQLVVSGSLCVNDTRSCFSGAPCRKLEMKSMSPYEAMSLVLRTDRRVDQLTALGEVHYSMIHLLSPRFPILAPNVYPLEAFNNPDGAFLGTPSSEAAGVAVVFPRVGNG